MDRRIVVVGGGLIGSTAAVALDRAWPGGVVHVAPEATGDERTTALLTDAIDLLEELEVWEDVRHEAAPLRTMRLLDGSRRLVRPRPIDFQSSELGLAQFGYNIRNDVIVAALNARCKVERRQAHVERAERRPDGWSLTLSDGSVLAADALVAADGRNSTIREAAGIGVRRWSYPQEALVTTFGHERPHGGVSAEFHTETGPFTQVPLPSEPGAPNRSSLVWVVRPDEAEGLKALEQGRIETLLGEKMGWMLGAVTLERGLAGYPLSGLIAHEFGRDGVFLIGEAGHVFPPIGAQGANLGFRDIRTCREALEAYTDPVAASLDYGRKRSADVATRTTAVDLLNRSILTGFLPVQLARLLGTGLLSRSDALRHRIMKLGLAPA